MYPSDSVGLRYLFDFLQTAGDEVAAEHDEVVMKMAERVGIFAHDAAEIVDGSVEGVTVMDLDGLKLHYDGLSLYQFAQTLWKACAGR